MAETTAESSPRFVFTNTADPTKDEQVKRVESRITIERAMETKTSMKTRSPKDGPKTI